MVNYIIRRILMNTVVFFMVTVLLFLFINMMPGDPITSFVPPAALANAGPDFLANQRHKLGLDKPLYLRYFIWLKDFLRGNLGVSIQSGRPVSQIILERMGPTLLLTGMALIIAILLGMVIGLISAVWRGTIFDYSVTSFSFMAVSIPNFFAGLILIYIFSLTFGLLPTGGMKSVDTPGAGSLVDRIKHLILPTISLGLYSSAYFVRYVRSSILDVLNEDYVRTARAKGLKETVVLFKHVYRNALIPFVTVVAMRLPMLFGGAVVTEQVFSWPGMGRLVISAVDQRDYMILMGVATFFAIVVLMSNFLADVMYGLIDPRIRYD